MTTTRAAAARTVSSRLDTLWDFDYEPTHAELESLYETAKKNQWNGSIDLDWSRPIGKEGPVLNTHLAFMGTEFFPQADESQIRRPAMPCTRPDDPTTARGSSAHSTLRSSGTGTA